VRLLWLKPPDGRQAKGWWLSGSVLLSKFVGSDYRTLVLKATVEAVMVAVEAAGFYPLALLALVVVNMDSKVLPTNVDIGDGEAAFGFGLYP